MLTPPPPPPASLPPPPRRFMRRFNRVPAAGFCLILLIVGGVFLYTLHEKQQNNIWQRELNKGTPSGADASTAIKGMDSGYIKAARMERAEAAPIIERQPINAEKKTEAPPPPTPSDDGLEKARNDAWVRHWAEYAEIRKDHFDNRKKALTELKTASAIPSAASEKAEPAAAAAPSPTPISAPGGASNFASLWGGGGGYGGYGGLPGFGGAFGGLGPTPQIDRESQEQKIAFANQKGDLGKDDVVPSVHKPPDPLALMAGSFVPFTTINTVNSDVPGSVIGKVSQSIYNNDGNCILVPQGARLIGHYNSVVGTGQERLPGVWTRMIYPDGSSQAIGAMEVADNAGSAGMEDEVNRHLLAKFGSAALTGIFGAGIYLAVPHNNNNNNGYDAQQVIGASLAQQIGQTGQEITRQALSIPNTVTIRAGYNGTMITDRDIHISPPWSCNGETRSAALPIMSVQ